MTIFITGTDTNVGKTFVSSWICYHTKASYWKPIQTGKRDAEELNKVAGCKIYEEAYILNTPICPYSAAKKEGKTLDPKKIVKPSSERLIIEGAGGVLVPIAPNYLMIDLIKQLEAPVLLIVKNRLGAINHACLTLEALRFRKIPILGLILNGQSSLNNREVIEEFGKVTVLDELPTNMSIERKLSKKLREVLWI